MTAIKIEELSKSFGEVTALADLSLTVEDGEFFGLLGQNGAGKTTTINILTGQLTADSGTVSVLGRDPHTEAERVRENVGILPEKESPPSFLTPREYFSFVGEVRDLDPDYVTDRIDTWADRLEFHEQLDTLNKDLSRGQQQKVMLTQAFLHEPDLVFIDEPLANIDPLMQTRLKDHLRTYHDAGNTIVLSTHHIEVAEDLCSRVGIIHGGQVLTEQRPAGLSADETLLDIFTTATTTHD